MSKNQIKSYCCKEMAEELNAKCDIHSSKWECADIHMTYNEKHNEYGIIIHDGGESYVLIRYCPWCGNKLPESSRDS